MGRFWLQLLSSGGTVAGGLATVWGWWPVGYPLVVIGLVGIAATLSDWLHEGRLSTTQRDRMAAAINDHDGIYSGEVSVRFSQGRAECQRFAEDIATALRMIGWRGEVGWSLDEEQDARGLRLTVKSPRNPSRQALAVAAGFHAARIDFDWAENIDMADNQVAIWVYPRRR